MRVVIGAIFWLIIAVVVISLTLHVSAGWAWIVALAAIAAIWLYRVQKGGPRRLTRMGGLFRAVCPYCGKRAKPSATICRFCGQSLVS